MDCRRLKIYTTPFNAFSTELRVEIVKSHEQINYLSNFFPFNGSEFEVIDFGFWPVRISFSFNQYWLTINLMGMVRIYYLFAIVTAG